MSIKQLGKLSLKLVVYSVVLWIVSRLFPKYFYIDMNQYGIWLIVSACVINLFNYTLKPILFKLTLPITALTYGLFYPMINVCILYLTSILLQSHFIIHNVLICFLIAVIISILRHGLEHIIHSIVERRHL